MYRLSLRPDFIETIKTIHKIKSDRALADAIGVGYRTLTRVKADPEAVSTDMIAGFCVAFGYSPSDVVEIKNNRPAAATARRSNP